MPPARDQLPDDIIVLKDTIIQNYYETLALCNWTIRVAALLKPMLENFKQNILGFACVQADETGLQALKEPGRKAKHKSLSGAFAVDRLTNQQFYSLTIQAGPGKCQKASLPDTPDIFRQMDIPQLKTADDFRPFTPQNIDKSLIQAEKEKYR
ncbi:MAG: hypothetical protein Kow0029_25790 [Candidatus Rifleibacteriota bacterium]